MRKVMLIALMLVLCSITTVPTVQAEHTGYQWTDHFDYDSIQGLTDAGWSMVVPAQTSLNGSAVVLSGIGQDNSMSFSSIPSGISDWRAETKGRWTGGAGGSIGVGLSTEHRSYYWWIDGYYNSYVLSVGTSKVLQIPAAPLQLGQWNVLTMVKIGNNISLYHDSQYVASYVDNGTIGNVISVINVAPWQGTTEYDYYTLDAAPAMRWQTTYGGVASDTGYSIVSTKDGGFAVLGVTKSYGSGQYAAYLIRGDAEGKELWNKTYGSALGEWAYSLSSTTDGGFLIGGTTTISAGFRAWMVKVTSDGTIEWNNTYGITSQVGFSSIQTSDGGYAITGYVSVSGRATDVYLLKTDPEGNQQWMVTYGGLSDDWGKSLIQMKDGGFAITGWTNSFGAGTRGYLIRTDQNGIEQFNSTFGSSGSTVCYGATQLSDGGLAITGQTNSMGYGGNDILAIRTDPSGAVVWEKTYGGAGEDFGFAVFALDDGFVFGGSSSSFNSTLSKLILFRTDLNGTLLNAGVYGLNVPVSGSVSARSADGGFLGVGNTNIYNSGSDDVYVLRLTGYSSAPSQPSSPPSIMQQALPPVAAVAIGSSIAFIGVFVVSRGTEAVATVTTAYNGGVDQVRGALRRFFRLDKVFDFVNGFFKGRAHSLFWKQVEKVELEDTNAVHRQPLFAGFSGWEMGVIFFTSVFLGLAFMLTNKIDLGSPTTWLVYIIVAGLAVSLHDLVHRYMAWRHNVVTEYKFWFLGTIIMFLTAILFGVVYSSPSRLAINDTKDMTVRQQAIVYGSGPIMSFAVFAAFLALIPFGGYAATIGTLGASMNLLTATYALMPFEPMDGRKVYVWNKWVWAILFLVLLGLYFALTIFVL